MSKVCDNENQRSSADWLARFRHIHPRSSYRDHDPKFGPVFVRGKGVRLWDADGQEYLDLTCGYSTVNFGHAFEPLVKAAQKQLLNLTHLTGEPHCDRILLAERLVELLGRQLSQTKVLFNVTGSRAIESAWKAAVAYRPGKLLTLGPCFHGRSLATLGLSGDGDFGFGIVDPASHLHWKSTDYPYCSACALNLKYPGCRLKCVDGLFEYLNASSHVISAVLVEPTCGARGYIAPPAEFFQRLESLARTTGILLIADEIQTGLGRCGDWLMSSQQGWHADLVVLGKALGGGIAPISAVVGRGDVLDCLPVGSESETFSGSPLSSTIALEVLRQLESKEWMENGKAVGQELRRFAREQFAKFQSDAMVSIEGQAACCVLEFAATQRSIGESPATGQQRAREMAYQCLDQGLLVHWSGPTLSRIVLLPPLTTNTEETAEMLNRLGKAIKHICLNSNAPKR